MSQAVRGDANGDGIEDGLFSQIAGAGPGQTFDVIVVFNGPDAVSRGHAAAGPFRVTRNFSLIDGFQASLTAAQIRGLSHAPGLFRISGVSTVSVKDSVTDKDFGATAARTDFAPSVDGTGVTICVVDTGINAQHEQFDHKGPGGVPLGAAQFHDSVNGQVDPYDDHGHGTHVSGIAAGDGTGGSYAAEGIGVAPGASLVVAKVLNGSGSGTNAQVLEGMDWCGARSDVSIVSMSLGDVPTDGNDPMSLAVNCLADPSGSTCGGGNSPKIVVVAAGNSGDMPSTVGTPATAADAISVGSAADWSGNPLDGWQDDGLYLNTFSSRGPVLDGSGNPIRMKPDIVGPGSRVLSAFVDNPYYPYFGSAPNEYAILSGTSMATPYVSGVVALMLQADPSLGVADGNGLPYQKVRDILTHTAVDRGAPGPDNEYGYGVIDAKSAVAQAMKLTSYTANSYPGYVYLPNQTVGSYGNWPYAFTVTSDMVGLPVAGTMTIHGTYDALYSAWSPDLELMAEQYVNGSWTKVAASSGPAGNTEVTDSECPAMGECGSAGRVEVAHFTPQSTGQYRFRVYPSTGINNGGNGGTFDFEVSIGAATPAPTPNYPPDANFTYACTDLVCTFTDASTDVETPSNQLTRAWSFGGAGTANLADPTNPSFTYDATGYYKVSLTVTDPDGGQTTYSQFVTARAAGTTNQAPTANFTASNTDLAVSFTDTSTDSDGAVVSWSWDFGDPAASAAGNTSTEQNPTHTYASGGTYNATLTVTDNEGLSSQSVTLPVTVTDPPPNMPPVASYTVANNPCGSIFYNNKCTFTDTSDDPDGSIASVVWDFDGGSPSPSVFANAWDVSFPADGHDPVHVTVTVTDNMGATSTYGIDVPLTAPASNTKPRVTVTDPADGASFKQGDPVTFTGTASDMQDDDATLTSQIVWTADGSTPLGTGAGVTTSNLSTGTHTITASVTDSGALSDSTSITVTVSGSGPVNTAPTVSITSPADGTGFVDGDTIQFTATAQDTQDNNQTLTDALVWTDNGTQIGTGGSFSLSNLAVGDHTITATATDSGQLTGSASVFVSVYAPPPANTAPVITVTSPATGLSVSQGTMIDFAASVTDDNDCCLSQDLKWVSDIDGQIPDATSFGSSFSTDQLSVGTHTITVSVTDSGGLTGTSAFTLDITSTSTTNTPPTVTMSSPADGANYNQGDPITFSASAQDTQDNNQTLTDALVWTDNGSQIGTGATPPSISNLSPGSHTIVATATDSGQMTGSAQATINVTQVAHVDSWTTSSASAPKGHWDATVNPLVLDAAGNPVAGANVTGTTSDGTVSGIPCTTDATGRCQTAITISGMKNNVASVTFSVSPNNGISGPSNMVYLNGGMTSVTVMQPGSTTNTPPSVAITSPADGATFASGASITFQGTASDQEDTTLSASSISWSSSIDGPLGTGSPITPSPVLSDGVHNITALVTDSGGLTSTATITITVGSAPPPPQQGITLSAGSPYKGKGALNVDLTWSGASTQNVVIKVSYGSTNSSTTVPSGSSPYTYSVGMKTTGTYTFQVCETGGGACSGTVDVVF